MLHIQLRGDIMPAYIAHAIMGSNVYDSLLKEKMFIIPININDIKTFSLGIDLGSLPKGLSYKLNNKNTKEFFISMINYIKENKLLDNNVVMALLYGHMAHCFLDLNCHPLIYYNELGLKNVTSISNHHLVEGYISYYLCQNILKKDFMKVKADYFNQGMINDLESVKMLNYLYQKLYNEPRIIISYNQVIKIFSIIESIIKCGLFRTNDLSILSGFNKFLRENNVTPSELINATNSKWKNPVTGEKHYDSIIDLYYKSIIETLEAINNVNKFLYKSDNVCLDKIFTNISYETGIDCNLGHQMTYVRKLKK